MPAVRGRPRRNPPLLAYDIRRCFTLAQMLALEDAALRTAGLRKLCEGWGVDVGTDEAETVHRLARHAASYHHKEGK